MQQEKFIISLDAYQGPLDLLLELIEKEKLDITTVSLAKITDDFLAHVKTYSAVLLPSHLASFLVIASRLILIKSRILLPFLKFTEEEEEDMDDLEKRLVLYKTYKEASKFIKQLAGGNDHALSREQYLGENPLFYPPSKISPDILKTVIEGIIKEWETLKIVVPEEHIKISVSLQNIIRQLKEKISSVKTINFNNIRDGATKKIEIILTFLAILEMTKEQAINTRQSELFGEIILIDKEEIQTIS